MIDLNAHIESYRKANRDESRFCICGNYSHVDVCANIKEITGIDYEYVFYIEEELFGGNAQYPLNCMLFYPKGSRDPKEAVTVDEISNLYWYCNLE